MDSTYRAITMPKPKSKNRTKPTATPIYISTAEAAALFNVSRDTLKTWRLGDRRGQPAKLRKGIHWINVGERKVLFNRELMQDFAANYHAPNLHQKAIEAHLAGLPSSKAVE